MWAWIGAAQAISGPWVVGDRQLNVYVGADVQRLERLQVRAEGGADADVIDVGEGISTFGFKGIATVGLASRIDLEVQVPWYRVQANRPDAELCQSLGLRACDTTQGLGILAARAKVLVLDQVAGAPVSLSIIGVGRVGAFTHRTRARITNLGEGTQDLGLTLSSGYIGALRDGFWSVHADAGFLYRLPNTRSYPLFTGDVVAPSEELHGTLEAIFSPVSRFGLGPRVDGFLRPRGVEFLDAELGDPDRLAALSVGALRVGGTLVARADKGFSASLSVDHTVAAFNNPFVTAVSAGVSVQDSLLRK